MNRTSHVIFLLSQILVLLAIVCAPVAGRVATTVQFARPAQQATLLDHLHEGDHMAARVKHLEQAITETVKLASPEVQEAARRELRGFIWAIGVKVETVSKQPMAA